MGCNALTSVLIAQISKLKVKIEQYLLINVNDEHGVKLKFMVAGYYNVVNRSGTSD